MSNAHPATQNLPAITVSRTINAPRQRVFDAWLNADSLKQWWCRGCGSDDVTCEIDARVGGRYRVTTQASECGDGMSTGKYLEIQRPSRLVFTWDGVHGDPEQAALYDVAGSRVEIDFTEVDAGSTKVTLTHIGLPTVVCRDGHHQGWEKMLQAIAAIITH